MAKEEIHNYIRTLLALAVVIFAGGGYAMKISSNSSGIKVNAADIKITNSSVHKIEIRQAERIATDKAISSALLELKTGMAAIQVGQIEISGDLRETKVKVETLIKD